MGFFSDMKMDKVTKICENSGLYRGTHSENCESCKYVIRGKCITGLGCSLRTIDGGNMITLANYKCDNFAR